jgi:hypothetical protein
MAVASAASAVTRALSFGMNDQTAGVRLGGTRQDQLFWHRSRFLLRRAVENYEGIHDETLGNVGDSLLRILQQRRK